MNTSQKLIAGFLLILILILTNMFASLFSWKIDLTSGKIFTLSQGSQQLAAQLEEPVDFVFYFSRTVEDLPISFKNYGTRVEEMLRQFEAASKGMIHLNIINPKPDTEEEEAAMQASISGNPMSNGETLFFGLTMTQADNQETIQVFDYRKESSLEYDIAKALYTVQQWDKPTIGLISGLPIVGTPQFFPGQQPQSQDWVFVEQLRQTFEFSEINSADDWPAVVDVLMVVHPQNLDEQMLFEIDQHIMAGNPTFIALDPSSYFMKANQNQQQMMMGQPPQGVTSSLGQLFTAYGIEFSEMEMLVDNNYAARVQSQGGTPMQMPTWLNLTEEAVNQDEFIMSQLDSLLFVESGTFGKTEDSELEIIPLIQSSGDAGTIFAMLANQIANPLQLTNNMNKSDSPETIAGFVRGNLKTAFPDGRPLEPPEEGEEAPPPFAADDTDSLKESNAPCNLFVVTDTDWMQDQFSTRRLNFMGVSAVQPLNDNLNLLTNAVEFMSGSQELISIRPKGNSIRPFIVVDEIEKQAQVEYQQKLDALNQEVQGFETRIRELQTQQGGGNSIIITPELQAEIAELNKNAAAKRSERREVRKKLREKVESLNFTLALANLAIVPCAVFVLGVIFFIRRHHRK
tara:strand:+ start:2624 stop:4507 length:1884 start_codon:yes stop_codon:yes gene_type:complete